MSRNKRHHTPPAVPLPAPSVVTIVPDLLIPIARLKAPDEQVHTARGVIPIAFRVNQQGCEIMDLKCTEEQLTMLKKEGVNIKRAA